MTTRIRYMGNKHDVAPVVAQLVRRRRRDRPFLDVFCGLCSVGGAIATTGNRVIGNDIQSFAVLVARCLLATKEPPPSPQTLKNALSPSYRYNQRRLHERFAEDLSREDRILADGDAEVHVVAAGEEFQRDRGVARGEELDAATGRVEGFDRDFLVNPFLAEGDDTEGVADRAGGGALRARMGT